MKHFHMLPARLASSLEISNLSNHKFPILFFAWRQKSFPLCFCTMSQKNLAAIFINRKYLILGDNTEQNHGILTVSMFRISQLVCMVSLLYS